MLILVLAWNLTNFVCMRRFYQQPQPEGSSSLSSALSKGSSCVAKIVCLLRTTSINCVMFMIWIPFGVYKRTERYCNVWHTLSINLSKCSCFGVFGFRNIICSSPSFPLVSYCTHTLYTLLDSVSVWVDILFNFPKHRNEKNFIFCLLKGWIPSLYDCRQALCYLLRS